MSDVKWEMVRDLQVDVGGRAIDLEQLGWAKAKEQDG